MDRWTSHTLEIPMEDGKPDFVRADLVFRGVEHLRESFEARVFVNEDDADENTPTDDEHGYAGYFVVFGHGGCAGDEGHCDVPDLEAQRDPEDLRLAHPLTPQTKLVVATEALQRLEEPTFTVTVIPVQPGESAPRREDVLQFEEMQLRTYE
jgi:hypothetical protein